MVTADRAIAFLEEYTDVVLFDPPRRTISCVIDENYFDTVFNELDNRGYGLIHKTPTNDVGSLLVVFIAANPFIDDTPQDHPL